MAAIFCAPPVASAGPATPDAAPVTIIVTTLLDKLDPNDGKCSFREAMAHAFGSPEINVNECPVSNGNTLITFAVAGTIVLTDAVNHGGLPDTVNRVTIQGPVTIDAAKVQQIIFDVESNGTLNLIGVNIKNASYTAIDSRGKLQIAGGKFENNSAGGAGGGAIRNDGTAIIAGASFINNKAVRKPDEAALAVKDGGAIRTTWKLTVAGSTFTGNTADGQGGAIAFKGGNLDIADSAFTANVTKGQLPDLDYGGDGGQVGEGGGAISLRASANTYPMTIKRTAFSGNVATEGIGGAIHHDGNALLTITDSSFQANHVGMAGKLGAGGAIHNQSQLVIKRSMFTGNSATGDGGALANEKDGQVKLLMTGFAGNNASGAGGAITHLNITSSEGKIEAKALAITGNIAGNAGGGIYNHDSKYDKAELKYVVMAGNLPNNCEDKNKNDDVNAPPNTPDDAQQWPVDSAGKNSFSDTSCDKPEAGDEQNADPKLAPVPAANGSTVPGLLTQKPLIGSPLIDKIPAADWQNDPDLKDENSDVRGMPRAMNGNGIGVTPLIDIGPYEVDDASPEFSSLPLPGSVITVGTSTVGATITKTNALVIYNSGAADLQITGMALGGANPGEFSTGVSALTISGGGSNSVNLACTPSALGTRTATLSFNTNDPRPGKAVATYTLRCNGAAAATPGFSSSPPAPGPVNEFTTVGLNDNFNLAIKEIGNAALSLSAPMLTSNPVGAFGLVTPFPINIADGAATGFVVLTGVADTPGLKTGTLSFNTNDPQRPTVSFDLACQVDKAKDKVFAPNFWSTNGLTPNAGPYGIALSPDGKHAYVADEGSSKIVVFRAQTADGSKSASLGFASSFDNANLSANNAITAPYQVAVSADGRNVYATGLTGDSIATFSRDTEDGSLTWVDTVKDGAGYGCDLLNGCAGNLNGLDGAYGIAISPDGKYVYVSSVTEDSIVVLQRNASNGALSSTSLLGSGAFFVQQFTHPNLNAAYGMALSPDGGQLYATSYTGDGLLVLGRDPISGTLTMRQVLTTSTVAELDGVFRVVTSADGRFVYTAGGNAGTGGVCVFGRSIVDGTLTYNVCYTDSAQRALNGASDLALSPDGKRLFVSSRFEDGVNAFERNPDTGRLSFADVLTGATTASGTPLQATRGVAVAPDGKYVYATGHDDDAVVSIPIANPVPLANALAPAGAMNAPNTAFTLTVNGEGFLPTSRVRLNGIDLTSVYVNATQMQARLTSVSMGGPGSKDITVWNPTPGGGSGNTLAFTVLNAGEVPPPSVLSVDVLGAVAGAGPISVNVNGMDFINGAQVLWNGSPRPTTFVSSMLLNATLTAEDMAWPGTSAVTVQNPSTQAQSQPEAIPPPSNPAPFVVVGPELNPLPSIATLSPVSAMQLSQVARLEVRVSGNGFVLGAQATFNGENKPTQFVDGHTLTMTLSAGDLVMPGVANVVVTNPGPGGGNSNVAGFEVVGADLNQVFSFYLPLAKK